MNHSTKIVILLLRIAIGWILFYAGISKILNPEWTAAAFLQGAGTFAWLYAWFGSETNIAWVNFLNSWGVMLVGAALMLGFVTRFASYLGILVMILYYLAQLKFPYAGRNSLLIDQHIVFILVLSLLITVKGGYLWGLDGWIDKNRIKLPFGLKRILNALG